MGEIPFSPTKNVTGLENCSFNFRIAGIVNGKSFSGKPFLREILLMKS
jgi:hypothetical protein